MTKCPHCGSQVMDDESCCPLCGTAVRELPKPVAQPPYPPAPYAPYPYGMPPMPPQPYTCPYCRPASSAPAKPAKPKRKEPVSLESKFTGGGFNNSMRDLLVVLVSVVTVTLALPAMLCWKKRWEAKNTYINGRQLVFTGEGAVLFGWWWLWLLLSLVTGGLFLFFGLPRCLINWFVKNTHFVGSEKGESKFESFLGEPFGTGVFTLIVGAILTPLLLFGIPWGMTYLANWAVRRTSIDGVRLTYDDRGSTYVGYFGKCWLWLFLTVITLGIFAFWVHAKNLRWHVSRITAEDPTRLPPVYIV